MRVNEIFCSLQGEGFHTGRPAVFLRFSGCNLKCPFCDTRHEEYQEMTEAEIVSAVSAFAPRHIVITGGEPLLQLNATLTEALHEAGFFIQVETNGTCKLAEGAEVDWITCSPKRPEVLLERVDELKVLCYGDGMAETDRRLAPYAKLSASQRCLQPLDTGNPERNKQILEATIAYLLEHPEWRLSLQTHKLMGVR